MEPLDKLRLLGSAAEFDVCGFCPSQTSRRSNDFPFRFIHRTAVPGRGPVNLFKVLLTNVCVNDCAYCVNQASRDVPRSSFHPEELSRLFMELHRRRLVQGLFLSSGIGINPTQTMERMIDTVAILRHRHGFQGYIHLKLLPGASLACVEEACRLASRVSVNMEAPSARHLARLSSRKELDKGILEPMRWAQRTMAADPGLVPAGQTTQFVVGAAGESDSDILHAASNLYRDVGLRRAYFSAFQPVRDSPLENAPPTPPMREHRLYQCDWLLRIYGFSLSEVELALGRDGNLALSTDPKLVVAQKQPWLFPVDVNAASFRELLRVPGIGPLSARRILRTRREHKITSLEELRKMGAANRRAAPYLWLKDMERPSRPFAIQHPLFSPVLEPAPSESPA
jgi:putative DNA modification/repair radical SAM protein